MARALAAVLIGLVMALGAAMPTLAAVKATVNGVPISDVQVSQRLKLFALEGRSGAQTALKELIDEQLMMQEAKRLGIEVTDAQVADALLGVARNIKVSSDKLKEILTQNGVSLSTLQDRLRAALAWNSITQNVIVPRVQISDVDLEKKAEAKMDPTMEYDYILKEVLFVAPGGKGASARTAQANQYKKSFQGCDSAVQLSASYTDAAVIDIGRRHATQMPEPIAKELANLNVGGITKPRVVENGVSMLAVCSKSVAQDTTFIKSNLRQEAGNEQLKGEQDKYLAELREKGRIIME